ncbi:AbiH family protein [Flavobacterium gelidilacus]|uniref:AbiH family protein n=1 Tax=Flavobacterium gelidilacus TaxID=206041 RepID=UPI0003FAD1BC|nr:AbiH family protein [Flavobacterium gelidilacus]
MSKILITGNGFDLFHHLPTKYGHFMAVMKTIEENNFHHKVPFDEFFGKIFKEKYFFDYNSIIENYNTKKIEFEINKVIEIKDLLTKNKWYKHFKTVNDLNTWIDFENEIENVLNLLDDVINDVNRHLIEENIMNSLEDETSFTYFKIKEFEILRMNGYSKVGYFLDSNRLNKRDKKIDIVSVLEELRLSLDEFITLFKLYLENIVLPISTKRKTNLTIPFDLLDKIYTFNYTQTIENLYNYKKTDVVYLHGNIISNNLTLDISNVPEIIKKNKAHGFTKKYQRIIKNCNQEFIALPDIDDNNLEETIFYIIGHSLDESDKYYIISLFEFLKRDKNATSKIYIFYYNEDDYRLKLNNLFTIIDSNIVDEMNKKKRLCFFELNEDSLKNSFQKTIKLKKNRSINIKPPIYR